MQISCSAGPVVSAAAAAAAAAAVGIVFVSVVVVAAAAAPWPASFEPYVSPDHPNNPVASAPALREIFACAPDPQWGLARARRVH